MRRLQAKLVLGGVLTVALAATLLVPSVSPASALPPQANDRGEERANENAQTHGPDGRDLDGRGRGGKPGTDPGVAPAAPYDVDTRAPWTPSQYDGKEFATDQADLTREPQFHAIYVYPSDRPSRFQQFAAMFQADAAQASARLSKLYGRGLRLDYRAGPVLDVTVVKSAKTYATLSGSTQFNVLRNELTNRGLLSDPNKKYVAWLDAGSNYCGQGEIYNDARRSNDNYNQRKTFSAVYRPYATSDPETGGFCRGRTLAHELGHNMGALQPKAPNAFDGAHCDDSAEDVMCYASRTTFDSGTEAFDYRNDDYWDPPGGALPWWTVNLSKYVCPANCSVTASGTTTSPATNAKPTAAFTYACSGLSCSFTDTSTDDGTITTRSWTFGDGQTSTTQNPSRAYGAPGTYDVTLTVTDDAGESASVTRSIVVSEGISLQAFGSLRSGGYHTVDLRWSGASTASVDLHRNGTLFRTTENDGQFTNNLSGTGSRTYTYKVCESGSTRCSPDVAVTF